MTTPIEWDDETWNPLRARFTDPVTGAVRIGWHCEHASAGCIHCYAEQRNKGFFQLGTKQPYTRPSREKVEIFLDEAALQQPLHWKKPRMIFVCSMTDLFGEWQADEMIDRVFAVMALCLQHTFQILTKRAERMHSYCTNPATAGRVQRAADCLIVARECSQLIEARAEIAGYPGYCVLNTGKVLSAKRGELHELQPDAGEQGHLRVPLFREGGPRRGERHLVHRLVLEAFVGPPPAEDSQACHRNGDPSNNALPNLKWGDQSDNWEDRKRHGNGRSWSQLTLQQVEEIKALRRAHMSKEAVGRRFEISATQVTNIERGYQWAERTDWPLPNCWMGVSCEDQKTADERIPWLLKTPAAVRWVSYEPGLGPVDFRNIPRTSGRAVTFDALIQSTLDGRSSSHIDWIVVGGESGPGARPFNVQWARDTIAQCKAAGVPVFVKQVGGKPFASVPACPPRIECQCGLHYGFKDKKGGDINEFPEDLRVREFPR